MEKNFTLPVTAGWQQQLAQAFDSIDKLCEYLQLNPHDLASEAARENFSLRVPRGFAACMEKGNPADPLLKQVLPVGEVNEMYNPAPAMTRD